MSDKQLPGYRDTCRRAVTSGQDPRDALERVRGPGAAAAAEVVTLLTDRAGVSTTKTGTGQEQEAPTGRPYLADVTCRDGIVKVTVDPRATGPPPPRSAPATRPAPPPTPYDAAPSP
ncbi:hypothetical protein [Streptomyces antibioticus]|uniref:hypothetical protein n=1 Tax=Streptomyces antibioticus TaxID=1890 RepID=UPI0033D267CD